MHALPSPVNSLAHILPIHVVIVVVSVLLL